MRVLLPLRKVASDAQVSNSNLQELEETSRQEVDLAAQASSSNTSSETSKQPLVPKEQISVLSVNKGGQLQQEEQNQPQTRLLEAKKQTSALPKGNRAVQTTEAPLYSAGSKKLIASTFSDRSLSKRKAFQPDFDTKPSRKRPAVDRKPAARDTMVAPGRSSTWSYHRNRGEREDLAERAVSNGLLVNRHSSRLNNDDLPSSPESDVDFEVALKKQGLEIREQAGDGNCLFRAVSLQVYGDPSMHMDVRKQCMDHMVSRGPSACRQIRCHS